MTSTSAISGAVFDVLEDEARLSHRADGVHTSDNNL